MGSGTSLLNASRPARALAAVGLGAAAAVAATSAILLVTDSLQDRAVLIEERRMELGRLRLVADRAAGQTGPVARPLSEALQLASFQTRASAIAEASGVDLLAMATTPVEDRDGARFGGLALTMTGPNDAILDALHAIESAEPALVIRSARLVAADAAGPGAPQLLTADIRFEGVVVSASAEDLE